MSIECRLFELKALGRKKKEIPLPFFLQDLTYDKIFEKINPIELLSVFVLAFLIKKGVDFTQSKLIEPLAALPSTWKMFPWALPLQKLINAGVVSKEGNEPIEWLISIAIAYVIVKNFDSVKGLGSNLLDIAKGLI